MPLHKVSKLADQGDKKALISRQHFGDKYDEYYMERTSNKNNNDETEIVVISEDTPGLRRTVNIICMSTGHLGVRPLPSECDVIIVDDEVFVAGEDEYSLKFTPV